MIEVKPEYQIDEDINQVKFKAAREYCDKNDTEFSVWTEKDLWKEENN